MQISIFFTIKRDNKALGYYCIVRGENYEREKLFGRLLIEKCARA